MMSIQVTWDSPDLTILRYIHYGSWTWENLDDAIAVAEPMIRGMRHPVHVIVDLRECNDVPNLEQMTESRALSLAPGTSSYLILVGEIWVTRKFYELTKRLYRNRRSRNQIAYTESIDQARLIVSRSLAQTA